MIGQELTSAEEGRNRICPRSCSHENIEPIKPHAHMFCPQSDLVFRGTHSADMSHLVHNPVSLLQMRDRSQTPSAYRCSCLFGHVHSKRRNRSRSAQTVHAGAQNLAGSSLWSRNLVAVNTEFERASGWPSSREGER